MASTNQNIVTVYQFAKKNTLHHIGVNQCSLEPAYNVKINLINT